MSENPNQLVLERVFKVSREELYSAWTDPKLIVQWMGPGSATCKECTANRKVGGSYRIHMVSEEGDHIVKGEYKEIVANERLQYTWSWENGVVKNTLVTVTFHGDPAGSKLVLLHERFETEEAVEMHTSGWNGCIDGLEKFLA